MDYYANMAPTWRQHFFPSPGQSSTHIREAAHDPTLGCSEGVPQSPDDVAGFTAMTRAPHQATTMSHYIDIVMLFY